MSQMATLFVGEFDASREDWTEYAECLAHSSLQIRLPIKTFDNNWPNSVKLLWSLISPAKLDAKSYRQLVEAMKHHHNPTPSNIVQRYRFNSRFCEEGESVAKYLAQLQALAVLYLWCDSGGHVTWLVCRIEDPPVQQHHLVEKHLTFKKAAYVPFAMETAAKNAETFAKAYY